jgi:hypothetical protein
MAAMEGTSRRPAFNPFQFDRVSTAPFILCVTHPLSFARKRARRAWPPDFPSPKTAAARVSGARDAAYRWRETRTPVLRALLREIRASPPATVPNTTRDTRCRRPILRGKTPAFFSARREASRGFVHSFLFRPLKIPLITTRWTDEKHPKT